MSSPIKIQLKDSCLQGRKIYPGERQIKNKGQFYDVAKGIDALQKELRECKLQVLSLTGNDPGIISDEIISYKIGPNNSSFHIYTSHYIDFFQTDKVHIEIKPRLFCGENEENNTDLLFHHILEYAANIYIPPVKSEISLSTGENYSILLLTLLWTGALEYALTHNFVPKSGCPLKPGYFQRFLSTPELLNIILPTPALKQKKSWNKAFSGMLIHG